MNLSQTNDRGGIGFMNRFILNKDFNLRLVTISTLILITSVCFQTMAGDVVRIKDLQGAWKFSIGESKEWRSPKFDDSDWETILVPSPWEDQGFNGYNGYATYRKSFEISPEYKERMLYLFLGYIDDVDEVYVNGKKIGSTGSFPPYFETAYNAERKYYLPNDIINFTGRNIITVVVYDTYQQGGIVSGNVGLYAGKMVMNIALDLQGTWKYKTGDDLERSKAKYDDSDWDEIFVPAKWEDQHYRDYDGFGWYRKTFTLKPGQISEKMVLLLGKIDDLDQVFINGVLVGSTGTFPTKRGMGISTGDEWKASRGYFIPEGILKEGQTNTIAVRVYDSGGGGGIYEGPVGLITQSKYIEYWRKNKTIK
jgi:hypothetical protein